MRRLTNATLDNILKMSQTPANYWGEFILDIPVGIFLIYEGSQNADSHPVQVIVTILIGLFLFSFIEYFFHRWLFHGSMRIMVEGHSEHHANPLGYSGLPFFLPALVLMGLVGVFMLLLPMNYSFLLVGTIALGYVAYGLSHFIIHHFRFRPGLARRWAANHHIHHFHPETNFGVTTPLWDIVFKTLYVRK
ncbi:sterol desaturase family protein [Geopsychrobacter electrodiphilus]|uniref:sterol desaturase family protein n=1 Tax=Geopsychrobacter electrodiphilus TaxID=225196 RepID=UPI000363DF4A|nr:sterol desaturase family protein [Geopsychrobacter electrodiphilus]